jgi:hypothetical protein
MKIITHTKRPAVTDYNRRTNPFSIWLHSHVELRIKRGDTLGKVAIGLQRHWTWLTQREAREVVAYWFTLGERVAHTHAARTTQPWDGKERGTSPKRAYSPKS